MREILLRFPALKGVLVRPRRAKPSRSRAWQPRSCLQPRMLIRLPKERRANSNMRTNQKPHSGFEHVRPNERRPFTSRTMYLMQLLSVQCQILHMYIYDHTCYFYIDTFTLSTFCTSFIQASYYIIRLNHGFFNSFYLMGWCDHHWGLLH